MDKSKSPLREALGELLGKFERHATYRLISQDETELTGNFRWLPTGKCYIEDVRYQEMRALSLSSPIEPPAAGKGPTETMIRMFLWQGHGHEGIYGDDGEMQCGECGVDYKRDSLDICVEKARIAALQTGLAKLAQPTAQASSEIREARLQELDGVEKHLTQHPYGASVRQWIKERRALLAPSRQGPGGSTKS